MAKVKSLSLYHTIERTRKNGRGDAKVNVVAAFESSGQLPENVNYAIKNRCVLSFLESVPEVKLKPINQHEKWVAEIASQAEQSSALILVYGKR